MYRFYTHILHRLPRFQSGINTEERFGIRTDAGWRPGQPKWIFHESGACVGPPGGQKNPDAPLVLLRFVGAIVGLGADGGDQDWCKANHKSQGNNHEAPKIYIHT
jgi:hypothetical protein